MYSVGKVYANINMDVLKAMKVPTNKNDKSSNVTYDSFKIVGNTTIIEENEFWESSGRRIFKGERTKIKHFPFMATIQIFNNFHCAGSIIKSDLIITASSCLQLAYNNRLFRENPAFLSARVGSSFYNGGGEVISVQEVYFHPSYDPKTLRNNICLLRLARHLKFRRKIRSVKKIDFDRHESTLSMTTSGITIVGWGAKEHSPIIGSPWKNILSFAELHVYPLEDCQDVYSKAYVTKKNFCAGFISRGGGACNRDVGGPGIVENKLMGIISFGSPVCGSPDMPTVFTKVGYYTDWIEEIMEQPVIISKKRTTLKSDFNPFLAQPIHIEPDQTTFKIPPLTGEKMKPIPITEIDGQLRISDEKLFKEFLATMFNSQEIAEYEDIINPDNGDIEINDMILNDEDTEVQEEVENQTQINEVSNKSLEESEKEGNKYEMNTPAIEDEPAGVDNLNKDLANLLENVQDDGGLGPKKDEDNNVQTDDQKVLTLLYLSDEDKKSNGGLSIPTEHFEDLTRSKQNVLNILPENELYALLSEVIQDEVEKINAGT
ncbi:putative Trypsin alpha [Danaus plexippus plexippus]|uniref:Trypsin alpha n=1 Tax=Danaus plexippus plexippus TaxID=278856 RepID=A0A212F4V2_DANPL|nr:putative Trypsin alpha [Danaus plexippus plexippus]